MKDIFGNSVTFASTRNIDQYPEELDRVLGYIFRDTSQVWTSDESQIGDFPVTPDQLKSMSKDFGFAVREEDYVKDVCRKLRKAK